MVSVHHNDYEKRRQENIRRNEELLAKLALPSLGSASAPLGINGSLKTKAKRTSERRAEPTRQSKRLLAKALAEKEGVKRPIEDDDDHFLLPPTLRTIAPRVKALPEATVPFDPQKGGDSQLYINTFKDPSLFKKSEELFQPPAGPRFYQIKSGASIAKLVDARIYSMAIHPSSHKIIVSAASKFGALSLWDASRAWLGEAIPEDERLIFLFGSAHSGSVTQQRYDPFDSSKLFTSSYDGTLRSLHLTEGRSELLFKTDMNSSELISTLEHQSASSWLFTDSEGFLNGFDSRQKHLFLRQRLHERKAGGLSVSVDPNLLATSSLDDTIRLWDMRKINDQEPLAQFEYRRAVTSVAFHPHIRHTLVATCYDDHLYTHTNLLTEDHAVLSIFHNNQTGRWITPFRAIWDPKSSDDFATSHIVIGDMQRGLDVIEMTTGAISFSETPELLTAQPAVSAIHPYLDLIASGTASGKVFLWHSNN